MPELTFVHKAILAQVADPSMYESLPDEVLYQVYSDAIGGIPLAQTQANGFFYSSEAGLLEMAAASHPLVHEYILAVSSIFSKVDNVPETIGVTIRKQVKELSGSDGPLNAASWSSRLNDFIRKYEVHNQYLNPTREAERMKNAVTMWLLKHFNQQSPTRHDYHHLITTAQASMVYILLIEKLVPRKLHSEWSPLAKEAEEAIKGFTLLSNQISQFEMTALSPAGERK